ncbi:MAG: hypothetical protein ACI9ZH_000329 [Paracoccaceae bacterium]|jgi:hypothetical protein
MIAKVRFVRIADMNMFPQADHAKAPEKFFGTFTSSQPLRPKTPPYDPNR